MDLTLLPLPKVPLCSLSIPGLAFQSTCHPAVGWENNFGRAVMVQIFPSHIGVFWVLLIYSFHSPLHLGSQNTETPIKVIPLRPSPCRKEPIIVPHAEECSMNTGSRSCVHQPGVCLPSA